MRPTTAPGVLGVMAVLLALAVGHPARGTDDDDKSSTSVVVAEGTGRDEKEARAAALRDAVSRVVGSLIDAETLVKNNRVIRDQVLEFSGGFVRTYDPLGTETLPGGLVRVRIKATVERLRVAERLAEAKVTAAPVRGADLLAERMTKDEAKKNATALLAKLYADLPKLAVAVVRGKPRLSADRTGLVVDVEVSVDPKAYAKFAERATALLDKVAVRQSRHLFAGEPGKAVLAASWEDGFPDRYGVGGVGHPWIGVVRSPAVLLGRDTVGALLAAGRPEPGYGVWLMAGADGRAEKTRWTHTWVDANFTAAAKALAGEAVLTVALRDARGQVLTEDERPVRRLHVSDRAAARASYYARDVWVLRTARDWYPRGDRPGFDPPGGPAITIAPITGFHHSLYTVGYAPAIRVPVLFKPTDDELGRVTSATARVEFRK